mmetsp:Transcript_4665/g.13338  ORF Transcript_4665/g.13338 Transcript_4665/m.13338 type:complete len:215 (-) Transcript_4665:1620-2264(-)
MSNTTLLPSRMIDDPSSSAPFAAAPADRCSPARRSSSGMSIMSIMSTRASHAPSSSSSSSSSPPASPTPPAGANPEPPRLDALRRLHVQHRSHAIHEGNIAPTLLVVASLEPYVLDRARVGQRAGGQIGVHHRRSHPDHRPLSSAGIAEDHIRRRVVDPLDNLGPIVPKIVEDVLGAQQIHPIDVNHVKPTLHVSRHLLSLLIQVNLHQTPLLL